MSAHKSKQLQKRKLRSVQDAGGDASTTPTDTSKPSAIFQPTKGRHYTLSVALPGSIIANVHKHEQRTALAGQIGRACAVFNVDEVVIFDDGQVEKRSPEADGYTAYTDPDYFLYHVLSYLETPPHLRKDLFPMHPDLKSAGALPSLDMPHHMRSDETCPYREGVARRPAELADGTSGTWIDCGLPEEVFVAVSLEANTRVTVRIANAGSSTAFEAASPDEPREEGGYYWGYSVRQASNLSDVFTECPYNGGYDISVGTSERGQTLASLLLSGFQPQADRPWEHLLVVFGGVAGLEVACAADPQLRGAGVTKASEVFDYWVNLVPGQGSRTIRTEEALWVGLAGLRPLVEARSHA